MRENNFVCSYCGVSGYKVPSRLYKKNFCNRDCLLGYYDKNRIIKKCDYVDCVNILSLIPSVFSKSENHFCSSECANKFMDKKVSVICLVCGVSFMKRLYEYKNTSKHFCSLECAKSVQKFKDWGGKRSKLEILIEKHLGVVMSDLLIDYNNTDFGYELDIYVPSVKLAIEINGVVHKKAIYGMAKLLRTQEIDREKVIICRDLGIELIVIDVSEDKKNKAVVNRRISEVEGIIRDRVNSSCVMM